MSNINAFHQKIIECSSSQQKTSSFFIGNKTDNGQNDKLSSDGEQSSGQSKSTNSSPTISKKRCGSCNKRVYLSSEYICKCNGIFCGKHRYPDAHNCTFNHRAEWDKILKKRNPHVVNEKISKI